MAGVSWPPHRQCEIYDMDGCRPHRRPCRCLSARVTNLENRRSIIVRVNDRGPYRSNRIIDLSRRSAGARLQAQGRRGCVQYLAAPLNGDDSYERRYLASQGRVHSRRVAASESAAVGVLPLV
jgi:rare lipoprotein A